MEYAEVAEHLGIKDYRVARAPNHHRYFIDTRPITTRPPLVRIASSR